MISCSEAELYFEHWHYVFTEEDINLGSPSKHVTTAKSKLRSSLSSGAKKRDCSYGQILINEERILCANEVFPEAAIADPLADLRIWDEWRSGARVFPYVGEYTRLSITNQPGKAGSTASIGVIGEIIAGLLGQALISPEILIRSIGSWPDFIFYPVEGRYSFLEAKAFTPRTSALDEQFQVLRDELAESLLHAVRHLAIDPSIKIWYSFTEIEEISPVLKLKNKLFELEAPVGRREKHKAKTPEAVIIGLAERAIQTGIASLLKKGQLNTKALVKKDISRQRKNAVNLIIYEALGKKEAVLQEINYSDLIDVNIERLDASIKEQAELLTIPEAETESSYLLPSAFSKNIYHFEEVRRIGTQCIYREEIPYEKRAENFQKWQPNINLINFADKKIVDEIGEYLFWRHGSFLFFMCDGTEETLAKLAHPENSKS